MSKKKIEPGDVYWKLIELAFEDVSIYDGPDVFLKQFQKLTPKVGHLLAAHWCQSEVCNGGFYQFFSNSTGVLAPEAFAGFEAIGLNEWASLLQSAMKVFGNEYPRSQELRYKTLPQRVKGQSPKDWDPFYELDNRFYNFLNRNDLIWEKAADAYAA